MEARTDSGRPRHVVIAGGGTGGHLYPGIAVAHALRKRDARTVVTFVGTARGIEARIVPQEGFDLDVIRSAGLKGKSAGAVARGVGLLPLSALDAWQALSRRRPDLVIGVGGYSSGPVVALAAARGIPTLLLEQNATPGLTNRWLARLVDAAASPTSRPCASSMAMGSCPATRCARRSSRSGRVRSRVVVNGGSSSSEVHRVHTRSIRRWWRQRRTYVTCRARVRSCTRRESATSKR